MKNPMGWRVVWLLALVAAVNYADRTALSAVFPLLRSDLGLTDFQMGAVGTLFLWSYALGSLVAGLVADRWPRNRVITASLLAWSLVTVLTGFARTGTELLATRVLLGLTECFYLPAAVALIADHHAAASRGRAMALHVAGLNLGLVGGGALAGYLGETYGWRVGVWLLGALGVMLTGVCWLRLREAPRTGVVRERMALLAQARRLGTNRGYLLLTAQAMVISVGTWMFFNWMPLYFQERFGLSLAMAGFSGTAVLQVAAVSGILAGGVLSDRASREGTQARLRWMVLCYLVSAPCLLVFLSDGGMMTVASGVVAFSFIRALAMANETPALCEMVEQADRGTAQSLMNVMNTLAGGAGVLVAGVLKADFGLSGVFAGVGVLVLVAAGLAASAGRTLKAPAVSQAV